NVIPWGSSPLSALAGPSAPPARLPWPSFFFPPAIKTGRAPPIPTTTSAKYRNRIRTPSVDELPLVPEHARDAHCIVWTPTLVEVPSVCELFRDLAQGSPPRSGNSHQ